MTRDCHRSFTRYDILTGGVASMRVATLMRCIDTAVTVTADDSANEARGSPLTSASLTFFRLSCGIRARETL